MTRQDIANVRKLLEKYLERQLPIDADIMPNIDKALAEAAVDALPGTSAMPQAGDSAFDGWKTYNALENNGRQYYAARAPIAVPAWFIHTEPRKPEEPSLVDGGSEHFAVFVLGWVQDPCWDLHDGMLDDNETPAEGVDPWTETELAVAKTFEGAMVEYWAKQRAWVPVDEAERFYQWRVHYATEMVRRMAR